MLSAAPAPPSLASPVGAERPVRFVAFLWTSGLLAVLTCVRLVLEALTRKRLLLDHPSGAWATLADDLLHGTFYRPIESALGWGGTRYPPLYPLLYAGVARVVGSLPAAAALLELLFLAVLVWATYVFLERNGVRRMLALPGALAVLALVPVQVLLGLGKADLLASALCFSGLAIASGGASRRRDATVALLFSLAVLTKWTVIAGLLAWLTHAWIQGRRRLLLERAAMVGGIVGAGVLVADLASGGQMLLQLRAFATGGGHIGDLLSAPVNFLLRTDPADLTLLVLVLGAFAASPRGSWRSLPLLAFFWTGVCLLATWASPGVAENHLLELMVLALVVFLVLLERGALPLRFAATVLPVYLVFAATRSAPETVEGLLTPAPARLLATTGTPAEGPLLAENPWVPLLAGQRPVLADPFTFRILAERRPELMQHLTADLAAQRFRAVVLRWPAEDVEGRLWYRWVHFGPGFLDALERTYVKTASFRTGPRPYWTHDVWRPRRLEPHPQR